MEDVGSGWVVSLSSHWCGCIKASKPFHWLHTSCLEKGQRTSTLEILESRGLEVEVEDENRQGGRGFKSNGCPLLNNYFHEGIQQNF